jgi:ATP/maltotriose-dependent transcriptional regulator MalT
VSWYRAALRLLPDDEARGDAGLALRMPQALALATAGAVEESRDALRELLAALPEGDEPRRAPFVTAMAAIDHLLGRYEEARELLIRELAALGDQRQAERAAIVQSLADNHYFAGDWPAMRDAAADAAALARAAGERALSIESSAAASIAYGAVGERARADAALADAREVFDTVPDRLLVAHLDAPFWLGLAELHLEDYAHARRVFERGIDLSRKTGQESAAVQLGVGQASVCALTGRLAEGRRAAAFAVDVARLMDIPNLLGWAEIARCWIALREGRLDEALEAGAYVERTVAELGVPAFSGGLCALAEARVLVGDPREGREALLLAAGGDELPQLNPLLRTWAYEVLTLAEVTLGEPPRAQGWAERAESSAAVLGLGRDRASAACARARAQLALGDAPGAVDSALASADAAQGCGALPQVVRARIVAGVACDHAGDPERAGDLIDAAHRDARTCGALGDRNEAERALRALGRRPRGRSAATAGSHLLGALTERERDVAELVADRLRNREIAARLHLSEKTIERHMSGILRKLGVDSRVDVARAVDSDRASR